jgi:hypothetical protein
LPPLTDAEITKSHHPTPEEYEDMNMGAKILLGLIIACSSPAILANGYFTGNPYSPYPPGCITLPARQIDLYGDNVVRFWSGSMWLEVVHKVQSTDPYKNMGLVYVNMYRVGCAEPNRSVIMAEFTLPPEWADPRNSQLVLPSAGGSAAWDPVPFEFKAEPNGWGQTIEQQAITKQAIGDYTGGWDDARRFTWRYVLDVGPVGKYWSSEFLTEYYNGRFWLELFRSDPFGYIGFEVPATQEVLAPNPSLPLNGRMTGTWVEPGAADQGFLLSLSNTVAPAGSAAAHPESSELVVFLTWFTFDARGDALWLAGSARFPQGQSEVTVPLVQVTRGAFLGSEEAERRTVGNLRLTARQCNALEVDYDLADLNLGSGAMHLQRLEALEIAGYPCRDFEAKLTSLASQASN